MLRCSEWDRNICIPRLRLEYAYKKQGRLTYYIERSIKNQLRSFSQSVDKIGSVNLRKVTQIMTSHISRDNLWRTKVCIRNMDIPSFIWWSSFRFKLVFANEPVALWSCLLWNWSKSTPLKVSLFERSHTSAAKIKLKLRHRYFSYLLAFIILICSSCAVSTWRARSCSLTAKWLQSWQHLRLRADALDDK